ncbi:hypothetical protein PHJA_000856900, partial [Phtheirospermum japonicum]
ELYVHLMTIVTTMLTNQSAVLFQLNSDLTSSILSTIKPIISFFTPFEQFLPKLLRAFDINQKFVTIVMDDSPSFYHVSSLDNKLSLSIEELLERYSFIFPDRVVFVSRGFLILAIGSESGRVLNRTTFTPSRRASSSDDRHKSEISCVEKEEVTHTTRGSYCHYSLED